MSRRDRQALVAGIVLGIISGGLTFMGALVAGLVFIVCSFVSPLIVSLIAQDRIMILSQVPNLLMALTATILIVSFWGYDAFGRYHSGGNIARRLSDIIDGGHSCFGSSGGGEVDSEKKSSAVSTRCA